MPPKQKATTRPDPARVDLSQEITTEPIKAASQANDEVAGLAKAIYDQTPARHAISRDERSILLDAISPSYRHDLVADDPNRKYLIDLHVDVVVRLRWSCEEFIRVMDCVMRCNTEQAVLNESITPQQALSKCSEEQLQILDKSIAQSQDSFFSLVVFLRRTGWLNDLWQVDEPRRLGRKRAATPATSTAPSAKRTKVQSKHVTQDSGFDGAAGQSQPLARKRRGRKPTEQVAFEGASTSQAAPNKKEVEPADARPATSKVEPKSAKEPPIFLAADKKIDAQLPEVQDVTQPRAASVPDSAASRLSEPSGLLLDPKAAPTQDPVVAPHGTDPQSALKATYTLNLAAHAQAGPSQAPYQPKDAATEDGTVAAKPPIAKLPGSEPTPGSSSAPTKEGTYVSRTKDYCDMLHVKLTWHADIIGMRNGVSSAEIPRILDEELRSFLSRDVRNFVRREPIFADHKLDYSNPKCPSIVGLVHGMRECDKAEAFFTSRDPEQPVLALTAAVLYRSMFSPDWPHNQNEMLREDHRIDRAIIGDEHYELWHVEKQRRKLTDKAHRGKLNELSKSQVHDELSKVVMRNDMNWRTDLNALELRIPAAIEGALEAIQKIRLGYGEGRIGALWLQAGQKVPRDMKLLVVDGHGMPHFPGELPEDAVVCFTLVPGIVDIGQDGFDTARGCFIGDPKQGIHLSRKPPFARLLTTPELVIYSEELESKRLSDPRVSG